MNAAREIQAAVAIAFLAIPQGIAYAVIAGLPPAAGLYAAMVPVILGSLTRSSRHLLTGPTNAVSLLVGTALAGASDDPVGTALTLALMVGAIQLLAGALRLGVLVDYIGNPVVLGYITGAAVLIAVGQLPKLTATTAEGDDPTSRLVAWFQGLGATSPTAVVTGIGVAALVYGLRRWKPRFPGALVALAVATAVVWGVGLDMPVIADIAPIASGLPPFTVPSLDGAVSLLPVAVAITVLSLVETSSVARALALESGQRLDLSREFVGQGLANLAASLTGAYPVGGSPSRSKLNLQMGGGPAAGALSGVMVLALAVFLGPLLDLTPLPALAGLLLVIAADLIDVRRIRRVLAARIGDAAAFVGTLVGTWVLPLDEAIYLGVGISLVMFLRRVRHLVVTPMVLGPEGRLVEGTEGTSCSAVRILNVEGQLFFAAASELEDALVDAVRDPAVKVLIVRLKRTQGLDATAADVLSTVGTRLAAEQRHLLLVGVRPQAMGQLDAAGVTEALGADHIYPTRKRWFAAMDEAIADALQLVGAEHGCACCPLATYESGAA